MEQIIDELNEINETMTSMIDAYNTVTISFEGYVPIVHKTEHMLQLFEAGTYVFDAKYVALPLHEIFTKNIKDEYHANTINFVIYELVKVTKKEAYDKLIQNIKKFLHEFMPETIEFITGRTDKFPGISLLPNLRAMGLVKVDACYDSIIDSCLKSSTVNDSMLSESIRKIMLTSMDQLAIEFVEGL